jgi:hypothetical protein
MEMQEFDAVAMLREGFTNRYMAAQRAAYIVQNDLLDYRRMQPHDDHKQRIIRLLVNPTDFHWERARDVYCSGDYALDDLVMLVNPTHEDRRIVPTFDVLVFALEHAKQLNAAMPMDNDPAE